MTGRIGRCRVRVSGTSDKAKDHATSAKELKQALGRRAEAVTAERGLRELLMANSDVEYGVGLVPHTKKNH